MIQHFLIVKHCRTIRLSYEISDAHPASSIEAISTKLNLGDNKIKPDYQPFRVKNNLFIKFGDRGSREEGYLIDIDLKTYSGKKQNLIYEGRNEPTTVAYQNNEHSKILSSNNHINKMILPTKSIRWEIQSLPDNKVLWGDGLRAWVIDPDKYPLKEEASLKY